MTSEITRLITSSTPETTTVNAVMLAMSTGWPVISGRP